MFGANKAEFVKDLKLIFTESKLDYEWINYLVYFIDFNKNNLNVTDDFHKSSKNTEKVVEKLDTRLLFINKIVSDHDDMFWSKTLES